jgi:hypothetical protein
MMIVVIYRMATTLEFSLEGVSLLLPVLAGYQFKRFVQRKSPVKETAELPKELKETLEGLSSDVSKLKVAMSFKPNEGPR